MAAKRYLLPKRFNVALSDKAYAKLRQLNQRYDYGNNYLLALLLENLDEVVDDVSLQGGFARSLNNTEVQKTSLFVNSISEAIARASLIFVSVVLL